MSYKEYTSQPIESKIDHELGKAKAAQDRGDNTGFKFWVNLLALRLVDAGKLTGDEALVWRNEAILRGFK